MIVWFFRDASDSAMLSQYLFALLDRRLTFRDTHTEILHISTVQPQKIQQDAPFIPRSTAEVRVNNGKIGRVRFDKEVTLTGAEREQFMSLLTQNSFYRIRIKSDSDMHVMAAIRACDLVKSGFKEELKIMVGSSTPVVTSGENNSSELSKPFPLSIDYRTPASQFKKDCTKEAAKYAALDVIKFQSAATIVRSMPGQAIPLVPSEGRPPPGLPPALMRTVPEGEGGKANPQQNQSFMRKYWYIILPLMLMLMTGGAPPEEGQAASGNGGQGQAAAAPQR